MERFPWQKALGLLLLLLLMSVLFENLSRSPGTTAQPVSYTAFKRELRVGNVQQVVLSEDEVVATLFK